MYALDLLGFGKSDKPVLAYNMELWRDQVADFLAEFVQEPVVLVGNSLGSLTCLMVCALPSLPSFLAPADAFCRPTSPSLVVCPASLPSLFPSSLQLSLFCSPPSFPVFCLAALQELCDPVCIVLDASVDLTTHTGTCHWHLATDNSMSFPFAFAPAEAATLLKWTLFSLSRCRASPHCHIRHNMTHIHSFRWAHHLPCFYGLRPLL